jgi:hypothetical protein
MAAQHRWDEVVATGDVARAVLCRFDLLTEVLGLDRQRATGWTLGRVLEPELWIVRRLLRVTRYHAKSSTGVCC